jgi:hypothetical protein
MGPTFGLGQVGILAPVCRNYYEGAAFCAGAGALVAR